MLRLHLILLLSLIALPAAADTRLAVSDGEMFTYKVSWAVVAGAGEIKFTASNDSSGATPQLRVTTTTATRGFARWLLPFDAKASSLFDARTGRLLSLSEFNEQRSKHSAHAVAFDYTAAQALYTVPNSAEKPRALPMPAGEPMDLITQLVQTRSWDLKPGEKRDALVIFDDEFYELTIHATRYEEVETSMGMFKTLVLEPRMEKTPLKGMFKKGSTVRVWISQDERRLPVKFEVEFKIGTGIATLAAYQPPSSAKATEDRPPADTATPIAVPPHAKNPRP